MGQFIAAQRDYLSFVSLFAYCICAVECAVLHREEGSRGWLSFLGFFLFQSLAVFWILAGAVPHAAPKITIAAIRMADTIHARLATLTGVNAIGGVAIRGDDGACAGACPHAATSTTAPLT